eukprot:761519-Hanusia_phi.AAC.6
MLDGHVADLVARGAQEKVWRQQVRRLDSRTGRVSLAGGNTRIADMTEYYTILGVARNASQQDVKKAYLQAAQKFHPDVAPEDQRKSAEVKFKEVNAAYEVDLAMKIELAVLGDPIKRREYDSRAMYGFHTGQSASRATRAAGAWRNRSGAAWESSWAQGPQPHYQASWRRGTMTGAMVAFPLIVCSLFLSGMVDYAWDHMNTGKKLKHVMESRR